MPSTPEVGRLFLEETRYYRGRPWRAPADYRQPEPYRFYPEAIRRLELPPPEVSGGPGLWETINRRRSVREFSREPLSLGEVSQLLWAAQGLTGRMGSVEVRAAASAGALYPDETYVFLLNVTSCRSGLAHYDVRGHALEVLEEGDFAHPLAQACLGQTSCAEAGIVVAWAAVIQRAAWKYADRAYRYVFLDAGHLGAHTQLAAAALGLGSVNIGAFYDEEVNRLLGVEGEREFAVYLTAVGKQ
jgi:SagB-type dehydrogenase family enzyme